MQKESEEKEELSSLKQQNMITGGRSFVSSAPAFSNDAKKLLVCTGNTVSVFSTSTGILITELEGHTDRVSSVVVVPASGPVSKFMSYCWTSSLDGSICYWDFTASELIKKVKAQHPIVSMVIPNIACHLVETNEKASKLYAFISIEDLSKPSDQPKALRGQVQLYNLTDSYRVGGLLGETRKPQLIHVSKSGEFIGIVNKHKLYVWRIPGKQFRSDEVKKISLHHTKSLSTLAFHPTKRIVAGGDVTGRILIWRGFGEKRFDNLRVRDEEEKPGVRDDDDADSCTTWHWHANEVKFIFFSSDGSYLYSGGKEGVIVVWQLDTGKKKFKPRLGSPLLSFIDSPDPTLSCITCADNQIHLLKMPKMEIIKSISGIKPRFSFPDLHNSSHSEFAFHNAAGLVALRGEDYCVQLFSLFDNMEVSQVQICERNFQPGDDVMVFVALTAISQDGSMMSTVDVKLPEEGLGGSVTLKFWNGCSQIGEYILSTVIYEPHSDDQISAVAFRPGHSMAVSSSLGGDFKVWVSSSYIHEDGQSHQKSGWRCRSVGSYKKLPMTAAIFSADGSVLAVAAESVVTLWDPDRNVLIGVIGNTISPICKLSFVAESEYLISLSRGSTPQIAVWNLSNMSMHWSYQILAEAISCKEDVSQFAILAINNAYGEASKRDLDGIILLFNVESPVPLATWLVRKAKGGGLAFLPHLSPNGAETPEEGSHPSLLVYINGDHEYAIFNPLCSGENQVAKNARVSQAPDEEPGRIGYASIYGELPEFDMKGENIPEIPFVPSERPWETIFSGSSHILPPLTKLCSVFLESLMEKRPTVKEG